MSKQLTAEQFNIETATQADIAAIGYVHLQSMLETYPNEEAGIDQHWINDKLGFLAESQGDEYRRQTVLKAETDPEHTLYIVVKNTLGRVVGFFHCSRDEQQAKLEAIYLIDEARGKGIADRLMLRGLEFAGDLPITLDVLDYNQRAIRLYEKYGFETIPNSHKLIRGKLPSFSMRRQPTKEMES
jgi:ribosomal protein S18 acetylase RimI-like enzyme